ncbi:MAG TPA: hypothetical protein VGJ15_07220 [Pirellulales bacterium]|jgi:hypothetical protein
MSHDYFWENIKALAAFLDETRADSEETLNHLEAQVMALNPTAQLEMTDEITTIITQLSRLRMRLRPPRAGGG